MTEVSRHRAAAERAALALRDKQARLRGFLHGICLARGLDIGLIEEACQQAAWKAIIAIRDALDGELDSVEDKVSQGPWAKTVALNWLIDRARARHESPVVFHEADDDSAEDALSHLASRRMPQPEDWTKRVERLDRRRAIRATLQALTERTSAPFISQQGWSAIRIMAKDKQYGSATRAANDLGISRQRISQLIKDAKRAVLETRYTAGVLGDAAWLRNAQQIHAVLDCFAASESADRAMLCDAAQMVVETSTGTRARLPAASLVPDDLHGAETRFARDIRSHQPNCVLVCETHYVAGLGHWTDY